MALIIINMSVFDWKCGQVVHYHDIFGPAWLVKRGEKEQCGLSVINMATQWTLKRLAATILTGTASFGHPV